MKKLVLKKKFRNFLLLVLLITLILQPHEVVAEKASFTLDPGLFSTLATDACQPRPAGHCQRMFFPFTVAHRTRSGWTGVAPVIGLHIYGNQLGAGDPVADAISPGDYTVNNVSALVVDGCYQFRPSNTARAEWDAFFGRNDIQRIELSREVFTKNNPSVPVAWDLRIQYITVVLTDGTRWESAWTRNVWTMRQGKPTLTFEYVPLDFSNNPGSTVILGHSPLVYGTAPVPPSGEGDHSAYIFDYEYSPLMETAGTVVGSSLNYDDGIVGAVTGSNLHEGNLADPLTYTKSVIPKVDLSNLITGNVYTGIGTATLEVTITDYENDKTIFDQPVNIKTNQNPSLKIYYASTAKKPDGTPIASDTEYKATDATTISGGEDGWTNQPLYVAVSPDTITGEFDSVVKIPGKSNVAVNKGTAISLPYSDNTSSTGVEASGVLTKSGDGNVLLSPTVTGTMKIDKVPPTAGASHAGGLDVSFTDTSVDNAGGSGLSTTKLPTIAIVPHDATPNDTDYKTFATMPTTLAKKHYDVYVKAIDKAGNVGIEKVYDNLELGELSSGVNIKKTTIQGATLHEVGCPNDDSIDADSCGIGCVPGAHKDILAGSTLTYKLELENTDTAKPATGSFEDLLPEGFDTTTPPTLTPGAGVTDLEATLEGNRWKITGDYSLAALGTTGATIACKVSALEGEQPVSKVISNQAQTSYIIDGEPGTAESNYANHRINALAKISKQADKGAAIHSANCANSTSIEKIAGCSDNCVAGTTGSVEVGDIITYTLTFENPSEIIQYFAVEDTYYDKMPDGVSIAGQAWSASLTGAGITTVNRSGTVATTGGTNVGGTWPDSKDNYLTGLRFDVAKSGVVQNGNNTLSLAPGAKLEITVQAKVTDAGSANLVNQIKSGSKLYGNNAAKLTTTDDGVVAINSNYTTHKRASSDVDVKFTKVSADDLTTPLADAEFVLYKWTGTTSEYTGHAEDILDPTVLNGGEASDKWLRAKANGADGAVTDVFTSDIGGKVDLGKLPDGIYTLIETKAPVGYELPVGQWVLTVDHTKGNTVNNWQIEYTAKGTMLPPATIRIQGASEGDEPTYKIVNVRPFSIGMSGMNGTKGITILGLSIMLIAGISYSIYNLKKSKTSRKKR